MSRYSRVQNWRMFNCHSLTNFYNSINVIRNIILYFSHKFHNAANAPRLPYTVSPSTREIIPLESVDATFVMTATSNALHSIFSGNETQLHRGHLISRAIKRSSRRWPKSLSARNSRRTCVEARHREREPAREWESSDRGGGWSRGGTRWTEEG